MFAHQHGLNNLVAIVDRNKLGATDFTENVVSLEPFASRWQSFGWDVTTVDGHSFEQLLTALNTGIQGNSSNPHVIIAETIKGKGVSLMENSPLWHHRLPKGDQIEEALRELWSR